MRERIVAAARRHYLAQGFRRVTMDDVAGELGMSKKTLYAHFPSKAGLLDAVLRRKFDEVEADLERITSDPAADAAGALRALLVCVRRHTEEIRPPFLRDMRREAPEVFERVAQWRAQMIERHFGRILRAGRRAGLFRRDVPVEVMVEILLTAMRAVVNPARLEELGLTPRSGFSLVLSVLLEGVLTPKARGLRR